MKAEDKLSLWTQEINSSRKNEETKMVCRKINFSPKEVWSSPLAPEK
jgi:hypothetical protein